MNWPADKVQKVDINSIFPNPRNPRTHSDKQINQIAAAIKEWGFTTAILVDENNQIIAGHGRHMAAQKLKLEQVPVMSTKGWSESKKRAYLIADNKLALNSEWDDELLSLEMADLKDSGFDLELTGFDDGDLKFLSLDDDDVKDNKYTDKIESPVYEKKGYCPELNTMYEKEKYIKLLTEIEKTDIDYAVKEFLISAATRHIRFNFEEIAEYYCHASPEIQTLMEDSALIIIDYDKAIADGFVKLTDKMKALYEDEYSHIEALND